MKNKDFAMVNCIDEKEANQILNWFLENFDEKDIGKLADILVDVVKRSTATINDFQNVFFEIKIVFPEFCDLGIIEDLKKMANCGVNAAKAGKEMAKSIKEIQKWQV